MILLVFVLWNFLYNRLLMILSFFYCFYKVLNDLELCEIIFYFGFVELFVKVNNSMFID